MPFSCSYLAFQKAILGSNSSSLSSFFGTQKELFRCKYQVQTSCHSYSLTRAVSKYGSDYDTAERKRTGFSGPSEEPRA